MSILERIICLSLSNFSCYHSCQVRLLCRWSLAFAFLVIRLHLKCWQWLQGLIIYLLFLIAKLLGATKPKVQA